MRALKAYLFAPPPVVMGNPTSANAFDLHSATDVKTCSFDGAQGKISWMQVCVCVYVCVWLLYVRV